MKQFLSKFAYASIADKMQQKKIDFEDMMFIRRNLLSFLLVEFSHLQNMLAFSRDQVTLSLFSPRIYYFVFLLIIFHLVFLFLFRILIHPMFLQNLSKRSRWIQWLPERLILFFISLENHFLNYYSL